MPATLLATKRVEKPWGRHHLYPGFPDPAPDAEPIGEVWFQSPHPEEPELLIKYLFTSEKLSVQDHPSDEEAHKRGVHTRAQRGRAQHGRADEPVTARPPKSAWVAA